MMRSLLWRAFLGVQFVVAVRYSASQGNVADVVKRSSDAIVLIVTSDSTGRETALGSGFLVSADGKVVTNFHVIKGAHSAVAKLANGAFFPVDGVLAADVVGDLVLLKVPGKGLPFLNFDASAGVKVGDHVVAIGSPLGLEGTVSDGIVSAIRSEAPAKNWIQTTAPVSHGNSGGPLLGMDGNVVGVITWGVNLQEGQNINFAIPSDKVQSLLSMHEQLSPIEAVASIRTQEVEANPPDQANSPNAGERHAIEQLRSIADAIKSCPPEVYTTPPEVQAVLWHSTLETGPPTNVAWDVVPNTNSIRARFLGSVEYLFPSATSWAPDMCSHVKKKRECNDDYWHVYLPAYNREMAHPQQYRYEFEVTPDGLEFLRGFSKIKQVDNEPWAPAVGVESCTQRAIRLVLAPPPPQQPNVAVDTKQALALFDAKKYVEARPILERACDAGNAKACGDLADIYDLGWGVAQDHSRSAALYLKACNAGNGDGCLGLGISYGNGDGVERDFSRARELYSESCDKGNALGCAYLGDVYRNGFGVAQDYQRAVMLYTKSCETGLEYGYGCTALGEMYQDGYGVHKDLGKSKQLYDKACFLGNEVGCTRMKSVQ